MTTPSDSPVPSPSAGGERFPRRICMDRWTPAERAIQDAVDVVEKMGADVRLTDAVILLGKAQDSVADYVDGVPRREPSPAPARDGCDVCGRSYRGQGGSYFGPACSLGEKCRAPSANAPARDGEGGEPEARKRRASFASDTAERLVGQYGRAEFRWGEAEDDSPEAERLGEEVSAAQNALVQYIRDLERAVARRQK